MKKTLAIFLVLYLISSLVIVAASTNSIKDAKKYSSDCIKKCTKEKAEEYNECRIDYHKDTNECKEEYKKCISNINKDDRKIFIYNKKNCRTEYKECRDTASSEKKGCYNRVKEDYKECKENCNENCVDIYLPVCGELNVQCFTEPCPPILKTFNNLCELKKAGVKFLYQGECKPESDVCFKDSDCDDN